MATCLALTALLLLASADAPAAPPAPAPFDFKAYEAQREAARTAAGAAQAMYETAKAALLTAAGQTAPGPLPAGQSYPQTELDNYLKAALAMVDSSLQYELASGQPMPLVLAPPTLQGWLTEWPGNPLDGWRPLRVGMNSNGQITQGDIAWQLCPPAQYSWVQGRVEPRSYSLMIFGAFTASPPGGVLATLDHSAPPYSAAAPAGADLAQLKSQAADEAWIRDHAQAWAARQPADADTQLQGFMLRGMAEYLRSAHYVDQLRAGLAAKPRAQWTDKEQTDYLQQALWLAYTAYNTYRWGGGDANQFWSNPADLEPYWPGNPYADWRRIELAWPLRSLNVDPQLLTGEDPTQFSPGDLFLDEAQGYYAQLTNDGRLSRSYELCIFGATKQSTAPNLSLPDATKLWADKPPPPGVVGCLELAVTPQLSAEFIRAICHS